MVNQLDHKLLKKWYKDDIEDLEELYKIMQNLEATGKHHHTRLHTHDYYEKRDNVLDFTSNKPQSPNKKPRGEK